MCRILTESSHSAKVLQNSIHHSTNTGGLPLSREARTCNQFQKLIPDANNVNKGLLFFVEVLLRPGYDLREERRGRRKATRRSFRRDVLACTTGDYIHSHDLLREKVHDNTLDRVLLGGRTVHNHVGCTARAKSQRSAPTLSFSLTTPRGKVGRYLLAPPSMPGAMINLLPNKITHSHCCAGKRTNRRDTTLL